MKKNLRRKIRVFLRSEDGRASIKAPLSLGVVSGSFLLAQAILTPSVSADSCDADCQACITYCYNPGSGFTCTDICAD